jgi:TRAP-type mannitol/chloroaromatic compound transport system permease small subunit
VRFWQGVSEVIDRVSRVAGVLATATVLVAVGISAGNALVRKIFNTSSNAWLEIQWYLFAALIMLGASYTLRMNEHVRVDLLYGALKPRWRLWIDTLGCIFFLLPSAGFLTYFSWDIFAESYRIQETSSNAGGLLRWPVKLLIPLGFGLLFLQGISELIKRVAALRGNAVVDTTYEKPVQ